MMMMPQKAVSPADEAASGAPGVAASGNGLAETLALYESALAEGSACGDLYEFSFAPLDRLGLPLWSVALVCDDGALCDGFGYGVTEEAARASAWGETLEWYFAREWLKRAPRRAGSFRSLEREGRRAIDPARLCLEAGSRDTPERELQWVEAARYPSGESVLVPIEFVAPRRMDVGADARQSDLVSVPITNGLGAGTSLEYAVLQGALELIQRDGNSVNYRALDQGVVIELDDVRDAATRRLLARLNDEGIEVIPKLAATDFGMTNLYVVGYDRDPARAPHAVTLSACGEAAHPDREKALAKALREFTSSRARKHFAHGPLRAARAVAPAGYFEAFRPATLADEDARAFDAMRAWLRMDRADFLSLLKGRVLGERTRVRFSELPTVEGAREWDAKRLLKLVADRLAADGLEVLYVDFTPESKDASVVRVIVPGLEVETMTYERVGRRNLERLLGRGSPLVGVGEPRPATAKPVPLTRADEERIGSPAWFDSAARERIVGDLYALYREPRRHVIGFFEESNQPSAFSGQPKESPPSGPTGS